MYWNWHGYASREIDIQSCNIMKFKDNVPSRPKIKLRTKFINNNHNISPALVTKDDDFETVLASIWTKQIADDIDRLIIADCQNTYIVVVPKKINWLALQNFRLPIYLAERYAIMYTMNYRLSLNPKLQYKDVYVSSRKSDKKGNWLINVCVEV